MTEADWNMHKNAINTWHEDAFQQEITWLRNIVNRDHNGEDGNFRQESVVLKGLVSYNFFRSWPIDQQTDTGEIDKQSCMLILNLKWLGDNGYLNGENQLDFNQGDDRFIIDGIKHAPSGDSQIAQAKTDPLLFFIILKREEVETGNTRF